ncbi:RNA polymerase sigma factor [Paenibacillus tritici]|uniref:RNA polymerase sigma factor n=2 Tax=Paenibacillus tritici TaxID=1873425 RepID=A0ABX2DJC4_9BACL|nr:RNA polymerase sigma factor [Paenibacillus tritici]
MNLLQPGIVIRGSSNKKGGHTQVGNKELFQTYSKEVYRTCYYMVHDAVDAEDLCQEVFITLFRSEWQSIEYLKAWIMKVTVNTCLNHLKRRSSLQQKLTASLHILRENAEPPVDRLVEQKETKLEWATYMSRLPAKFRAVLTLRYMHDFSLEEIRNMLDIPLGTVKSRQHKGLRLMKKILEDAGVQTLSKEEEPYGQNRNTAKASTK